MKYTTHVRVFSWLNVFNKLKDAKKDPEVAITEVALARQHYPRPSEQELLKAMESSISFIVARNPFERLVSGYRDKIVKGIPYYDDLREVWC